MHSVEDGTIVAHDGIELAYRVYGRGPGRPLLLLHGGGANLISMDQFAARIGASRTTVSFDLRCCGQSGDPSTFQWSDARSDVETVVRHLDLGAVDLVGHSMGGFVAGYYGSAHRDARVVSIDGFGPGMPVQGTDAERHGFAAFQAAMKEAFWAMTAPPETGDRAWRDEQIATLTELFPQIGYTAPNAGAMAERNLVDLGDGRFRRHPNRVLFEGGFADGGQTDVLRMYRHVRCPTLIIRCNDSGAPPILDRELAELASAHQLVEVAHIAATHLAPAWDALDEVMAMVDDFFARARALAR
jgi:pimeloyl-ACP methyl ester carboxylesterase